MVSPGQGTKGEESALPTMLVYSGERDSSLWTRVQARIETYTCRHTQTSWFADESSTQSTLPSRLPGTFYDDDQDDGPEACPVATLQSLLAEAAIPGGLAFANSLREVLTYSFESASGLRRRPQRTFHPFPLLPAEVRLMVWNLAIPERTLHLRPDTDASDAAALRLGGRSCWTINLPMPAMSRVCHEARVVVLEHIQVLKREELDVERRRMAPILNAANEGRDRGRGRTRGSRSGRPGHSDRAGRLGPDGLRHRYGQPVPPARVSDWFTAADGLDLGPNASVWHDVERSWDDEHNFSSSILPMFRSLAIGILDLRHVDVYSNARPFSFSWVSLPKLKRLRVVVQTIYIKLPVHPDITNLGYRETGNSKVPVAEASSSSNPKNIIWEFDMNDVSSNGEKRQPLRWYHYQHDGMQRHVPNSNHVTTVVELRDRKRLRQLLALGDAVHDWPDRRSMLDSLGRHDVAFCMDCLQRWWDEAGLPFCQATLLKSGRSFEGLRRRRLEASGEGEKSEQDKYAEIVPAVRFKIHWPELQWQVPPGTRHLN